MTLHIDFGELLCALFANSAFWYDSETHTERKINKDGNRHPTPNKWCLKIAGNQSNSSQILKPMAFDEPEPKEPGKYMLVFNGATARGWPITPIMVS